MQRIIANLAMPKLNISPWLIAQGVGFQLFWFSCVIGQNSWLALSLLLLALHFIVSPQRLLDFKVISIAAIGIAIDLALTQLSFFNFSETPYWLGILWFGFVISLANSMRWLGQKKLIVQMLFGGIAGSISYLTGEKFGAVSFGFDSITSSIILFLIWSILLPVLLRLIKFIEQNT